MCDARTAASSASRLTHGAMTPSLRASSGCQSPRRGGGTASSSTGPMTRAEKPSDKRLEQLRGLLDVRAACGPGRFGNEQDEVVEARLVRPVGEDEASLVDDVRSDDDAWQCAGNAADFAMVSDSARRGAVMSSCRSTACLTPSARRGSRTARARSMYSRRLSSAGLRSTALCSMQQGRPRLIRSPDTQRDELL